jgi:hypothetical protein
MVKKGGNKTTDKDNFIPGQAYHMDLALVSGPSNLDVNGGSNSGSSPIVKKSRDGYIGFLTIIDVSSRKLFYNKTPVDWYCKKESTTETATYGSEFLACRTCFEQIIDHCQYLRYLGAPVYEKDYAWRDNDAMINSATIPDAKLHK